MSEINSDISFNYLKPSKHLQDFVHLYWEHSNLSGKSIEITILPDSFFKVIIEVQKGKLIAFFLTGLWTKEINVIIPPYTKVLGIKFKLLSAEYIFHHEIATILQSVKNLQPEFWNIRELYKNEFKDFVEQIESLLCLELSKTKIQSNKLQLSQLLYATDGNILVEQVSEQINWSSRHINRYLNKYLGVSLKTYINIQKCYNAYLQIRDGQFYPEEGYFDQAHFIREIKKHTGNTPTELYKELDVRFIQLKNIQKK